MEEEAAALAEEIGEGSLPQVGGDGTLLLPPTPILREDNWPLLTVSKGFFENLAQQGALKACIVCSSILCHPSIKQAPWNDTCSESLQRLVFCRPDPSWTCFTQHRRCNQRPATLPSQPLHASCPTAAGLQLQRSRAGGVAGAETGGAPAADMEELDMEEGVGDAWGADDGLDLDNVEGLATDQDGVDEVVGDGATDDEEGGWEMEVPCLLRMMFHDSI